MEVEKLPLACGEATHIHDFLCLDAHALQGSKMRNRGNNKLSGVLKTDETPIRTGDRCWESTVVHFLRLGAPHSLNRARV